MKFSTTVIPIAIFASTIITTLAVSVRTKLKGPVKPDSYIVVLKSGEDMERHINSITRISARSPGSEFSINHRYQALNGYSAHATGASLTHIFSCPEVDYVEADGITSIHDAPHEVNEGRATGCNDVPAEIRDDPGELGGRAYERGKRAGLTMVPVRIYMASTGINPLHICFGDRVLEGEVFGDYPSGLLDLNGHGTMVAGVAVGVPYGVATEAHIIPLKVVSDAGVGSISALMAGLQWAVKQFRYIPCQSILVIDPTFEYNEALNAAVEDAISKGLHVVAPAGMESTNAAYFSPGSVPSAYTIGAIEECSKIIAYFSNVGPAVDALAPGVEMKVPSIAGPREWTTKSSTSMSAAFVAGGLANRLRREDDLVPPAWLKEAFMKHGTIGDVVGSPPGTTKLRAQKYW
ncbi:peptidase S8/S53 domain-containing protein [Cantharellus anzutake]|uniref:peptidase S8/S53 domain-containing protein n=1 Tax=Cantharellus anzutake TaxID=1750568 RepID=UPI00190876E7|nr:peptidase S8/S53 domain-containing protein [Cantharellus anzutake]KAF8331693.1 peptidase S8/S53 domain-containing protein [Cantharellus anzutake]